MALECGCISASSCGDCEVDCCGAECCEACCTCKGDPAKGEAKMPTIEELSRCWAIGAENKRLRLAELGPVLRG